MASLDDPAEKKQETQPIPSEPSSPTSTESIWQKAKRNIASEDGKALATVIFGVFTILCSCLTIVVSYLAYRNSVSATNISETQVKLNQQIETFEVAQAVMTATAGSAALTATEQKINLEETKDAIQGTQTQIAIEKAEMDATTATAELVNLNTLYFCSRDANVTTEMVSETGLEYLRPIKTPYWERVANEANHEFLFIAFINRGSPVQLTDITNTNWQPTELEPPGWNERNDFAGQEKMQASWAYALLVADRASLELPFGGSIFPSTPSEGIPLPGIDSPLPAQDFGPLFDCGTMADWNIEMVTLTYMFDPDGTPPDSENLELSDGPNSISALEELSQSP